MCIQWNEVKLTESEEDMMTFRRLDKNHSLSLIAPCWLVILAVPIQCICINFHAHVDGADKHQGKFLDREPISYLFVAPAVSPRKSTMADEIGPNNPGIRLYQVITLDLLLIILLLPMHTWPLWAKNPCCVSSIVMLMDGSKREREREREGLMRVIYEFFSFSV